MVDVGPNCNDRTLSTSPAIRQILAQRFGDHVVRLCHGLDPREAVKVLAASADIVLLAPPVNDQALQLSAAPTVDMARRTVSERLTGRRGAAEVLSEPLSIGRS